MPRLRWWRLDVNFAATASGSASTAYLNLQGGTLSVAGPTVVGHARMDTSATATSSLVTQSAGVFSASGAMTIGQAGLAQSIYNGTGGTLRAYNGLTVGAKGDGLLSISNAGNVVVSGTQGLAIGSDPSGATSGTVYLSGGSLATGNLILGNGGVGMLFRSGGVAQRQRQPCGRRGRNPRLERLGNLRSDAFWRATDAKQRRHLGHYSPVRSTLGQRGR